MQRNFLNVPIMFLSSDTVVTVATRNGHSASRPHAPASLQSCVCSLEMEAHFLINNEAQYKFLKLSLDSFIAYQMCSFVLAGAHFTTEIRNFLTVCSAYHSESTFLSQKNRKSQCPLFDSVGIAVISNRTQMCSRVLFNGISLFIPFATIIKLFFIVIISAKLCIYHGRTRVLEQFFLTVYFLWLGLCMCC